MQPSSNSSASAAITIAPVESGRSPLAFFACVLPVGDSVSVVLAGVPAAGVAIVGVVAAGVVGVTGVVVAPGVVAAGVVAPGVDVAPGVAPPEGTYVVVGVLAAVVAGVLVAAGTLVAAVLGVAAPAPGAAKAASSSASSAAQSDVGALRAWRECSRRHSERRAADFMRVVDMTRRMLTALAGALAEQVIDRGERVGEHRRRREARVEHADALRLGGGELVVGRSDAGVELGVLLLEPVRSLVACCLARAPGCG